MNYDRIASIHASKLEFTLTKPGKVKKKKGRASFEFTVRAIDGVTKTFKAVAQVYSIWTSERTRNAVRAILIFEPTNLPMQKVVEFLNHYKILKCPATDGSAMGISRAGKGVIRYGTLPETTYSERCGETNTYMEFYASKEIVLREMLDVIKRYGGKSGGGMQLSGLERVDLSCIDPTIIQQVGFEKIPDYFNRSPDMWLGNPDKFMSGSGYSSYGESRQAAEIFLDVFDAEIRGETVSNE